MQYDRINKHTAKHLPVRLAVIFFKYTNKLGMLLSW